MASVIRSTTGASTGTAWSVTGGAEYYFDAGSLTVNKKGSGISPILYFKYVKKKFTLIERFKIDRRLKKLEKAFNLAVENGQDALAEKVLNELSTGMRETLAYAKGFKLYISKDDLNKYKNNINGGHISDTKFEDYTRVIPPEVMKKKKEAEGIFDGFIIYHYWNPKAKDVKKMSSDEKSKMKDPVLFGTIKEAPDRLYFIADWEDEFCTLTFDEILDVIDADKLNNNPVIGDNK